MRLSTVSFRTCTVTDPPAVDGEGASASTAQLNNRPMSTRIVEFPCNSRVVRAMCA